MEFTFEVMSDESVRMADRLEAAQWLANRGFGKAELAVNVDLAQYPCLDLATVSMPDLEALIGSSGGPA